MMVGQKGVRKGLVSSGSNQPIYQGGSMPLSSLLLRFSLQLSFSLIIHLTLELSFSLLIHLSLELSFSLLIHVILELSLTLPIP